LIDIDVVSLVSNGWNIDLDGIIQINEWIEKVEGYLDETNIFLWDKWSVRGFPTLLVRSDDVKAGHGCNIEKISDEKLFYMRSRWIWKENALMMIVNSYIETIFSGLEKVDEDFHNGLVERILQEI
jgi:Fe-S cluster assembly scaffold protein SufB